MFRQSAASGTEVINHRDSIGTRVAYEDKGRISCEEDR
jgi:hypothetical protein